MSKWWNKASDDDLQQGLDLVKEIAEEARLTGDKAREAAAHEELNEGLDEAERRGWR